MKKDECVRHKLDEMVDCIRSQSGLEGKWENQRNTMVENHPYLIGYAFLIGLAVTFTLSHLLVFAISFLFLFFISDFMTRDVHRIAPFVPKAVLFSVLYILVIWAIILITYKVVPMMLKNLPESLKPAPDSNCKRDSKRQAKNGTCRHMWTSMN